MRKLSEQNWIFAPQKTSEHRGELAKVQAHSSGSYCFGKPQPAKLTQLKLLLLFYFIAGTARERVHVRQNNSPSRKIAACTFASFPAMCCRAPFFRSYCSDGKCFRNAQPTRRAIRKSDTCCLVRGCWKTALSILR